jgi:hypothetical protein
MFQQTIRNGQALLVMDAQLDWPAPPAKRLAAWRTRPVDEHDNTEVRSYSPLAGEHAAAEERRQRHGEPLPDPHHEHHRAGSWGHHADACRCGASGFHATKTAT